MPLPPLRSVVREFWGHISDGCTAAEAGVAVGVSEHTGISWFRDAAGVKPRLVKPKTSGTRPRLTLADRIQIEFGVKTKESMNSIGQRLRPGRLRRSCGRSITTAFTMWTTLSASRGIGARKRSGRRQSGRSATVRYCALTAQAYSDRRARRPKAGKLARQWAPARRCRLGFWRSTAPSRSPSGCGSTFPTMRRCGCRTRPSI